VLSKKEIKHLRIMSSKRFKTVFYVISILAGFTCLWSGISNLILSDRFAQMIDLNSFDIFLSFLQGFDISKSYSGLFFLVLQRFLSGLFQIVLSIGSFLIIPSIAATAKRNLKILKLIER
jgi:hypothetical protein